MEKIKILIDTDPGDDIDDVLAITYAIKSGYYEIVGVTTSFKDTDKRARIIKKMFSLCNLDVPVYAGYGNPLVRNIPESQEINQYTDDLNGDEFAPDGNTPEDAVDFIIECCHKYGNQLVILGIAPQCNLSRVILKDKTAFDNVKQVCIMGGCFNSDYPEWNIFCDVDSAKIVFDNVVGLNAVGVEITSQTKITGKQSDIIEKCNKDAFYGYVAQLVIMWRKSHTNDLPTLHDVLALCLLRDKSYCGFSYGKFSVNTTGQKVGNIVSGINGVTYANSLNKERFLSDFMQIWKF